MKQRCHHCGKTSDKCVVFGPHVLCQDDWGRVRWSKQRELENAKPGEDQAAHFKGVLAHLRWLDQGAA